MQKDMKVLIDLTPGINGYGGIPQEARLLFKTLCQNSSMELGGLIYSHLSSTIKYSFNPNDSKEINIIKSAQFLNEILDYERHLKLSKLQTVRKIIARIDTLKQLALKRQFNLYQIDTEHFFNFLWRTFFSKTLLPEDFELLKKQNFFITPMSQSCIKMASLLRSKAKLDTTGWDFAVFQSPSLIPVSKGTKKIVRYHDSIPIQDMDVCIPNGTNHHGSILLSMPDAFFVCNSEPTRQDLIRIAPHMEQRSATIAPILPSYKRKIHKQTLLNIIKRNSSSLTNDQQQKENFARLQNDNDFKYILILSTVEPRKNHILLIRAWERLRAQYNVNHRLMIVGSFGWKYDEVQAAMKPHVRDGDIIHLEKVLPDDMAYLYSHAEVFAFPSFNEGFGFPPLEAMHCECPVIASDIPTHRWAYSDAALYINPYDLNSLFNALEKIIISEEKDALRQNLIKKGLQQVTLYDADKIAGQWQELFNALKANADL